MRSLIRQLFPRPVSSVAVPRGILPQHGALQSSALQIVVPVIHVSDLPRR